VIEFTKSKTSVYGNADILLAARSLAVTIQLHTTTHVISVTIEDSVASCYSLTET